jgi:hypothetical protein
MVFASTIKTKGISGGKQLAMKQILRIDEIHPDAPIRLDVAARLAFPDGSMTASGLRRERDKGNLVVERICGKDFTTLEHIEQMRMLCRAEKRDRTSGSQRSAGVKESFTPVLSGSSSMVDNKLPQDALRAKLRKRKVSSPSISPANMSLPAEPETSKL